MRQINGAEIKQLELNLLECFDKLCEEKGLYYTLAGGTLLGAIRHEGFIPWDDDIDVLMPRPDYDKLLKGELKVDEVLPSYMKVVSWYRGDLNQPFIKLIDTRTKAEVKYYKRSLSSSSVWIDIFPIDGNPEDPKSTKSIYQKSLFLRHILSVKLSQVGEGKSTIKKLIKPIAKAAVLGVPTLWLCKRIDAIARTYNFNDSNMIGGIVWGYGTQEKINKNAYMRSVKVPFEGKMFNAPSNYDEYLTGLYGDYMKLPPENKRVNHEMIAYIDD